MTDNETGAEIRKRINEDGDFHLIEMARRLTDKQLVRLKELIKSGAV